MKQVNRRNKRLVFVVSTSGSVMQQVLQVPAVRHATHSVVADRPCAAIDKAEALGVRTVLFNEGSNSGFCARLQKYLNRHEIDYVLSFYTRFYTKTLREAYKDRIINFHPSLLPAFKGMNGFEDGIAYHSRIIGTTVELIKDVMDEGKIVMQTSCVVNPHLHRDELRHRIFVQQCKTVVQVIVWVVDNRVSVKGDRVTVLNASYDDLEFVPALEANEALDLDIPFTNQPIDGKDTDDTPVSDGEAECQADGDAGSYRACRESPADTI